MNIQYFLLAWAGASSSLQDLSVCFMVSSSGRAIVSLVTPAVLAAGIGAVQESHFCSFTLYLSAKQTWKS